MILNLVKPDNDILKQKAPTFDFVNPPTDPIQLAKDLYETLLATKYLCLTASQVGLPYRAFALRTTPGIVVFNPYIIDATTEIISLDEMCITYEHLVLPIKRARRIKVRYREPNSSPKTEVFDGMTARYFIQAVDQLNGIVYTQHASQYHLEKGMRLKKKLDRQAKKEL